MTILNGCHFLFFTFSIDPNVRHFKITTKRSPLSYFIFHISYFLLWLTIAGWELRKRHTMRLFNVPPEQQAAESIIFPEQRYSICHSLSSGSGILYGRNLESIRELPGQIAT
jgi:hypothetical protein